MERGLLNKLLLARRAFDLSCENLRSSNDVSLAVGINLLQDAVEAFLLAVAEKVNAGVGASTKFEQYFDSINSKIQPKELPFRSRLIAMNKLRVNSKHYGLIPPKSEADGLVVTVREFFEEVSLSVFGSPLATINLSDLLEEGEKKAFIKEAESSLNRGDFQACLIACRKAVYLEVEVYYDAFPFWKAKTVDIPFLELGVNKVPRYARDPGYLDSHVTNATDFIIYDHQALDFDLIRDGIGSTLFWNIWRLTPEVYRFPESKEWVVKYELDKLRDEGIKDRAEYVLDATINLLITSQQTRMAARVSKGGLFEVTLAHEHVPIYKKATCASEIVTTTPAGITKLPTEFRILSQEGGKEMWHVWLIHGGKFWPGYVSAEEVISSDVGSDLLVQQLRSGLSSKNSAADEERLPE